MKLLKVFFISLALVFSTYAVAKDVWVNGYTRSDGTQVRGHYRSAPNNTVRDNYSYRGNRNPYTGNTGSNSYRNSPSSQYYQGINGSGLNIYGLGR